jgi:hypothetical protein
LPTPLWLCSSAGWHPGRLLDKLMESMMYVTIDTIMVEGKLRLFFSPLVNDIVVGGCRPNICYAPFCTSMRRTQLYQNRVREGAAERSMNPIFSLALGT